MNDDVNGLPLPSFAQSFHLAYYQRYRWIVKHCHCRAAIRTFPDHRITDGQAGKRFNDVEQGLLLAF